MTDMLGHYEALLCQLREVFGDWMRINGPGFGIAEIRVGKRTYDDICVGLAAGRQLTYTTDVEIPAISGVRIVRNFHMPENRAVCLDAGGQVLLILDLPEADGG